MSKVFISYRRKSWGFTHRLADELRERLDAEVFVDVDSIDQTDFEKAIVNHLRQSDAVLLVVSETTFIDHIHRDDDWVRREIREALTLNLPLVMVCVDGLLPPSGLPDDIKEVARKQGVNFYPEFFTPAVERLTDFVMRVSSVKRKGITGALSATLQPITIASTGTVTNPPERQIVGKTSLDEALDLFEKGDFSKAIFLLEGLRESGFKSRFVNIDELLQEAQVQQQQAERRRSAQIDYEEIAGFVKRRITRDRGIAAFQMWQKEYADLVSELDSENLLSQFVIHSKLELDQKVESPITTLSVISDEQATNIESHIQTSNSSAETQSTNFPSEVKTTSNLLADDTQPITISERQRNAYPASDINDHIASLDLMPKPFDWIEIPAGKITLGGIEGANGGYITKATSFDIDAFAIAKYPLTNAQYKKFIKADGYNQPKWWTKEGWQVRKMKDWIVPHYWTDEKWNKPNYPLVGVSWYEAIAFCLWLSEVCNETIILPTDQQWQRAAQGDTEWIYPYGTQFDKTRCNFTNKGTTEVTSYEGKPKGDSPFGVVDMSGNIWEWCLTKYEMNNNHFDGEDVRVLRGGSPRYQNTDYLRSDYRHWYAPVIRSFDVGFRIARNYV